MRYAHKTRKKEEGRRKKDEGRRTKEEGRTGRSQNLQHPAPRAIATTAYGTVFSTGSAQKTGAERGITAAALVRMVKEWDLKERTMQFALEVATFCRKFPNTIEGRHVRGQLFRAATGTAANYRAVCRSKTDPDLIAKFGTVIEEADEGAFWLEFGTRGGLTKRGDERLLLKEANELVAIFMQGRKTTRNNLA